MSAPAAWMPTLRIAAPPVAAVIAIMLLAQLATFPNLPWHAGLTKPSFNPPNWIFGPVWTTLYVLMAYAALRIARLAPSPAQRTALVLFYAQLALNAAWSWMFFAAHSPLLGLINIVPQVILVVAAATAFIRLDRIAGICLLPLVAWVSFATVLNAAIWRLNG
jgi:translocator protein